MSGGAPGSGRGGNGTKRGPERSGGRERVRGRHPHDHGHDHDRAHGLGHDHGHDGGHDDHHDEDRDHGHARGRAQASANDTGRRRDTKPGQSRARKHEHGHEHRSGQTPIRRLITAFAITTTFLFAEAIVGWWSKSLALVADAGHMLADSVALGLAIFAQRIAMQTRTRARTYGFRRAEVLAAFANGVGLALTAFWILAEAIDRWSSPPAINAVAMTITAALGLVVNLVAAAALTHGAHGNNVNTRAALAHVLSDALGSFGAVLAGAAILAFGWTRADPVISVVIAALVLWGAWRLVRDTSHVLMEGSPVEIDVEHVEETLRSVRGVVDFHDLHVWSISEGFDVLTVHIVIDKGFHGTDVVEAVSRRLRERHGLDHVTIQPETAPEERLVPLRLRAPQATEAPAADEPPEGRGQRG